MYTIIDFFTLILVKLFFIKPPNILIFFQLNAWLRSSIKSDADSIPTAKRINDLSIPIEDNGVRETNKEYRLDVHNKIFHLYVL